jgi:hypothetical protein
MSEDIAFESHKWYTWVDREHCSTGKRRDVGWSMHLERCEGIRRPGSREPARRREATENSHWIIGEIEQARMRPLQVHPRKARLLRGQVNKSDKLDAQGPNRLQRNVCCRRCDSDGAPAWFARDTLSRMGWFGELAHH